MGGEHSVRLQKKERKKEKNDRLYSLPESAIAAAWPKSSLHCCLHRLQIYARGGGWNAFGTGDVHVRTPSRAPEGPISARSVGLVLRTPSVRENPGCAAPEASAGGRDAELARRVAVSSQRRSLPAVKRVRG